MQTEDGRPDPLAFCYGHMNASPGAPTNSLRRTRPSPSSTKFHCRTVILSETQRSGVQSEDLRLLLFSARRTSSFSSTIIRNPSLYKGENHENVPGK